MPAIHVSDEISRFFVFSSAGLESLSGQVKTGIDTKYYHGCYACRVSDLQKTVLGIRLCYRPLVIFQSMLLLFTTVMCLLGFYVFWTRTGSIMKKKELKPEHQPRRRFIKRCGGCLPRWPQNAPSLSAKARLTI